MQHLSHARQRSLSDSNEGSGAGRFPWIGKDVLSLSEKASLPLPTSFSARSPQRLLKSVHFRIVGIIAGIVILYRISLQANTSIRTSVTSHSEVCQLNMTTIKSFDLTEKFSYTRRYIKQVPFKRSSDAEADLAWVDASQGTLFGGVDHLSLPTEGHDTPIRLHQCSPEPLTMPLRQHHRQIDAKELVFGMATTADRLLEYAASTASWLGNTGAHLVVLVPDSPRVQELRNHLVTLGIDGTVVVTNDDFLVSYFKLVQAFHFHGLPESQWFTFIDDDTHYFSLQRFIDALHQHDASKEVYIGAITEDLRQLGGGEPYAFGGAGVTVSRGLLNHLHSEFTACVSELEPGVPGDLAVKHCTYKHTETKLTKVQGLHQMDLLGDSIGILEGPRPPISWHHYRSWSPQPVDLITKAGAMCGGACLFQRWAFSKSSSSLGYDSMTFHLGVSIVGYPAEIHPDLSKTETTWWTHPNSNFDQESLGPLRAGLQEGRDRFTYRLKGVSTDANGHMKHTYINYVDRKKLKEAESKDGLIDQVMELVFI